jgi:hypothetical protein
LSHGSDHVPFFERRRVIVTRNILLSVTRTVLLSMLACGLSWAQGVDDSRPAPTNVRGAEYPRVGSEYRVTFRLKAPEARKVQLMPSAGAVDDGLGKGPFDLVRGADGVWSLTTPPVVPGFHYYHISC